MSSAPFDLAYKFVDRNGKRYLASSRSELTKFSAYPATLSGRQKKFDALTAVFDLEGFTRFCDLGDNYLNVGPLLRNFTSWLFRTLLKLSTVERVSARKYTLLKDCLPVFWKSTGDGGFFIWDLNQTDTDWEGDLSVGNIIVRCHEISQRYSTEFVKVIGRKVKAPPARLRCGIARGEVIALQDGRDYVGSSINLAAHLQSIKSVAFAFCSDGIDPQYCFNEKYRKRYIPKRVPLRGGTDLANILVDRREFNSLPRSKKRLFLDASS